MSDTVQNAHTVVVNSETFQKEVMEFDGVVLVDFYADWCGPCKRLAPELEMIAEQYADNTKVKIAKLDTEEAQELAMQYEIQSIPNVIIFKKGKMAGQIIGLNPRPAYKQAIEELLAQDEAQAA